MGQLHKSPLDLIAGETSRANAALHDYAYMGPRRSFARLIQLYRTQEEPITRRLETLKAWSVRYDWVRRVTAWDRRLNEEVEGVLTSRHKLLALRATDVGQVHRPGFNEPDLALPSAVDWPFPSWDEMRIEIAGLGSERENAAWID